MRFKYTSFYSHKNRRTGRIINVKGKQAFDPSGIVKLKTLAVTFYESLCSNLCTIRFPTTLVTFHAKVEEKQSHFVSRSLFTGVVVEHLIKHCFSYAFALNFARMERQVKEMKEEIAAISRQEEEHRKRKVDSVSIAVNYGEYKECFCGRQM